MLFQGDFGSGAPTGSGVWDDMGVNPCRLAQVPASGTASIPAPQFRVGMVARGDVGSEFVYGKLVLGSVTDLLPGQVYQLDENFNATLLSTTNGNNVLGSEIAILNVWAPQAASGTYYGWFQRAGHAAVMAATGSVATGAGETSGSTAGALKFPASATAGQKSVSPATAFGASSSITFTGTTVSGSPYVTNLASGVSGGVNASINDLAVGMAFTMTGFTNAIIAGIDRQGPGGTWRILVGTNTAGSYATTQNATANGTGVTGTVTSHVAANLMRPTLSKQN